MNYKIKNTLGELDEIKKELKEYFPKLTEFELLQIAVQHQRNRILVSAFVIGSSDSYPGALEAIAIQLGFSTNQPL